MENQELENYLAKLERALGAISVSEKAEIIMEIKSHVLDAVESSPDRSLSEILKGLGEPEQVANRYLLERGLEPQKAPKHPIVKWLVIGFLGTFSISVVAMFVLLWNFTPLVQVDEAKGHVKILGGLIDVQEDNGRVKIGDGELKIGGDDFEIEFGSEFSGTEEIDVSKVKKALFWFNNAKLKFRNSETSEIEYDCDTNGEAHVGENSGTMEFNLKGTSMASCKVSVPKGIDVEVKAQNGIFNFLDLENNLNFEGMNGKVRFQPGKEVAYKYKMKVQNGLMDDFESSDKSDAYKIEIELMNGKIKN